MISIGFFLALATAVASPVTMAESFIEPISVLALHENARYYDGTEVAVSGYVVDSHTEWYGGSGEDYMTWNLLISDTDYPAESDHVLLCYESGFNIQSIRECSEIADIHKEMGRLVTVIGEYDSSNDILNIREFIYFEEGESYQLDTDLGDGERIRIYREYSGDFRYDVHYVVWHRHSHIWPHPIWWVWWEPMYIHRPPVHYVVYQTPWRTYRRRVYHPVRVPPARRRVPRAVRHNSTGRMSPRVGRERMPRTPARVSPRNSPDRRARIAPSRKTDRIRNGRPAPTRIARGTPRISNRQNVAPRPPARIRTSAPTVKPTRIVRGSPRISNRQSVSPRQSTRIRTSAPPARTISRSSPSSGGRTRAAPQRSYGSAGRSMRGGSRRMR